jgi:hypothetical protein
MRISTHLIAFALFVPLAAVAADKHENTDLDRPISIGELTPTPEMWFYQQELKASCVWPRNVGTESIRPGRMPLRPLFRAKATRLPSAADAIRISGLARSLPRSLCSPAAITIAARGNRHSTTRG